MWKLDHAAFTVHFGADPCQKVEQFRMRIQFNAVTGQQIKNPILHKTSLLIG